MLKRFLILVFIVVMLVGPLTIAHAQSPPQHVLDALNLLNGQLGTNLSISDLSSWTWEQRNFPDSSLGCPVGDASNYPQVITSGYIVQLTYNGTTYDFRLSSDRSIQFQWK